MQACISYGDILTGTWDLGQYITTVSKTLLLASIKQNYFMMHFSAHQHDVTWSSRNHMVQTPTQLQSTRDSKWVPPIFLPMFCTSRKNYKVSIAQKQHRGAWLIPSCGLRTAWGARVRLKVALSHPYILLVLRQFLPDHTLDLFLSFTVMSFTLQL